MNTVSVNGWLSVAVPGAPEYRAPEAPEYIPASQHVPIKFGRCTGAVIAVRPQFDGWKKITRVTFPPGSVGAIEYARQVPDPVERVRAVKDGVTFPMVVQAVPFEWKPEWMVN